MAPVKVPRPAFKIETLRAHRDDPEPVAVVEFYRVEYPFLLEGLHEIVILGHEFLGDRGVEQVEILRHSPRIGHEIAEVAHGGEDSRREIVVSGRDLDLHHHPPQPQGLVVYVSLDREAFRHDLLLVSVPYALLELPQSL